MATVKTAISLDHELFERVEKLAFEENRSRSAVFADAITKYIAMHEAAQLARSYDDFYKNYEQTDEDKMILEGIRRSAAEVIAMNSDGEEW